MSYVLSEIGHLNYFSQTMSSFHCPTCFFKEPSCRERESERKERRTRKNEEEEEHKKNHAGWVTGADKHPLEPNPPPQTNILVSRSSFF